jgi:RNA polymerase sigma-70 factor, ECF subfamily
MKAGLMEHPSSRRTMSTAPEITERPEQPYVAVRAQVTMQAISAIADRIPEVFGWLGARGVASAGAPFLKYNLIDMARQLEIEAGVPVAAPVDGDGAVFPRVLPAGRYVTLIQVGHSAGLYDATVRLRQWASEQGLAFDMSERDGAEHWACRLETYFTDPSQEPDMDKWETQLAFKLAG